MNVNELTEDELNKLFKYLSINIKNAPSNEDDLKKTAHEIYCRDFNNIPRSFSKNFLNFIEKLEYLIEKRSAYTENDKIAIESTIDSIYTTSRAMFCESINRTKNYTLQNCLIISGYTKEADAINNIFKSKNIGDNVEEVDKNTFGEQFLTLGEHFYPKQSDASDLVKDISFHDLIKIIVDKGLAHVDSLKEEEAILIYNRHRIFLDPFISYKLTKYIYRSHNIYESCVLDYVSKKVK